MKFRISLSPFLSSLILLVLLNLLVKPLWVLWADRHVQNATGLESYGNYFALLNLCMVMNFLLDVGLTPYVNRTVAADPKIFQPLVSQTLAVKLLLSVGYSGLIIGLTWATGVRQDEVLLLVIVLQILTSLLLLLRACITGVQRFGADAWLSVSDKAFVVLAVAFVFTFPSITGKITIPGFLWIQITGITLTILQAIWIIYQGGQTITWRMTFPDLSILRAGLPFALNIFFMSMLLRADGFLIERLMPRGGYHAGIYASGFRLLEAISMMGTIVAGFLLPYISRQAKDPHAVEKTLRSVRFFLLAPAIFFAAAAWILAVPINTWLYPTGDPASASVIRILGLALPGLALVQVYGTQLTATGHIRTFLLISGLIALAMLLADLWIIPRMGTQGAAWVAVATQTLYGLILFRISTVWSKTRAYVADLVFLVVLGLLTLQLINWLFL